MNERKGSEDIALVSSVMSRKLIKINTESNALQVAKKMSENKVSSVILTNNQDKIEGIVETFVQTMRYPAKLRLSQFLRDYCPL